MKSTTERYTSLADAYIKLSDKFHQLDVAHMALRKKLVPVIKAIKGYQVLTHQLNQDKAQLEQTIKGLTDRQRQLEKDLLLQKTHEAEMTMTVNTLTVENTALQAVLEDVQARYDAVADLEALLQDDPQAILAEAEQQMELVEETLQEIAINSDPSLSKAEQQLIESLFQDMNQERIQPSSSLCSQAPEDSLDRADLANDLSFFSTLDLTALAS